MKTEERLDKNEPSGRQTERQFARCFSLFPSSFLLLAFSYDLQALYFAPVGFNDAHKLQVFWAGVSFLPVHIWSTFILPSAG
jgi:hypothetical protein